MGRKIRCPAWGCGSTEVASVGANKNYKTGRGIVNGTLGFTLGNPALGLVGLATGFNGKKKVTFVCMKCGKTFTEKI